MEKKEGNVKDLEERLQRGELTSREALKKLQERKLTEGTAGKSWESVVGFTAWSLYFILCLLPTWARGINLDFLEWFALLQAFTFPSVVTYISIALVAVGTFFLVWGIVSHRKKGGLKKVDEAIILYKEGPYRIMRHPQAGGMMWPFLLPIIVSEYVSFTVLSIAAIVIMIIYIYWGTYVEENRLDIEKWGDEYRQYMKEVPAINFILGLWRLRKRREN